MFLERTVGVLCDSQAEYDYVMNYIETKLGLDIYSKHFDFTYPIVAIDDVDDPLVVGYRTRVTYIPYKMSFLEFMAMTQNNEQEDDVDIVDIDVIL